VITFSRASLLAGASRTARRTTRSRFLLRSLLLAGPVLALARPRTSAEVSRLTSEGINIILAIDISSSMLAEDFQPQNRLQAAQDLARRLVADRRGDRIGVVAFSAEAMARVPLTVDYPVVIASVNGLRVGQLEDGTALGLGIALAANRLRHVPGRSRAMVVLTDGVSNQGSIDPRAAAAAAAALGIRIYPVGFGTGAPVSVPVGRGSGGWRYERRVVPVDDALLGEIARSSGGAYLRVQDTHALEELERLLNRLELTPEETGTSVTYTEYFRWPLGAALAALALDLLLFAWRAPLP
jgi:Ca-activated chloride channel family protein